MQPRPSASGSAKTRSATKPTRKATSPTWSRLQSGKLDLSVETLVAQILTEKGGSTQSLEAVQQFLERAEKLPPGQGIEEELRVEALQAAKQAVSTLKAGGSK
jgi:hypothetical protein